ncbi:MAG: hypothetical protein FJ138_07240, partial [Deltaproteobacteria bacterium]|nr:hypothetical protein [Deltaproteobacteria bacterium]
EERAAAAAAREAKAQAAREERAAAAAAREAKAQAAREEREAAAAARKAQAQAAREARAQAAREAKEGGTLSGALRAAEAEPPAERAAAPERASVVEVNGVLQCPAGMWLRTKAPFPKGSVIGDRLKGAPAIELAKAGQAYCVDSYEYPGKGQLPKVNVSFAAAGSLCAQINKRLCTDDEWRRACRGAGDFPYGKVFSAAKCNTEDAEGEERKLAPGGSFKACSAAGVFDMSGNAAEWTASQTVRGGYYASSEEDAACGGGGRHAPTSQRPYIGFRCCADLK